MVALLRAGVGELDVGRGARARRLGLACALLEVTLGTHGISLGACVPEQRVPGRLARRVGGDGALEVMPGRRRVDRHEQLASDDVHAGADRRRRRELGKTLAVVNRRAHVAELLREARELGEDGLLLGHRLLQTLVGLDGGADITKLRFQDGAEPLEARDAKVRVVRRQHGALEHDDELGPGARCAVRALEAVERERVGR